MSRNGDGVDGARAGDDDDNEGEGVPELGNECDVSKDKGNCVRADGEAIARNPQSKAWLNVMKNCGSLVSIESGNATGLCTFPLRALTPGVQSYSRKPEVLRHSGISTGEVRRLSQVVERR